MICKIIKKISKYNAFIYFFLYNKIGDDMNYNVLRANDIRGEYPFDVNKKIAIIIGKAFGTYLNQINIEECIIGHDNRISSKELTEGLTEGLLASGVNIIDIGLVTTPMFNFASITLKKEYGIMITASHNKASDNGFKIFGKDFLHLKQEELKKVYQIIKEENFIKGEGSITNYDIKKEYIEMLKSKFGKINKKIAVDCGNGTASIIIKDIFSNIFKEVTYLNCESDGSFPIHNPDPNEEENLKWLKSVVKLRNLDLGIGIDGDADRVGIITDKGVMIGTDLLIGIHARDIIPNNDNKNVILDVKCSCALIEDLKKIGANGIMVKNGSAYIESVMHDTPALIGGEYSGHIFFKDDYYGFDDGIYAALRTAKLIEKLNIPANNLLDGFEKYYNSPEIRIDVSDDIKFKLVDKIKNYAISKKYDCNLCDGVRVNYQDGFSLVRCSNTSPQITLRFEAKDENTLNQRKEEFLNIINENIK